MKKIFFLSFLFINIFCSAQKAGVKKTTTATKQVQPSKAVKPATPPKNYSGPEASIIAITIVHNGGKTEINNKQFETWGGTSMANGTGKAIILNYGASNSKKNDDSFSWMFTIPKPEKGIYTIGNREETGPATSLQFITTVFPKIPMFLCKSGTIEITACPLPGGFVTGTFNVILTGGVTSDGVLDESEYNLSGSFSILRQ